eukprot:scaffold927_cov375-Prasinococcus_capsulatus_cf.AAC.2
MAYADLRDTRPPASATNHSLHPRVVSSFLLSGFLHPNACGRQTAPDCTVPVSPTMLTSDDPCARPRHGPGHHGSILPVGLSALELKRAWLLETGRHLTAFGIQRLTCVVFPATVIHDPAQPKHLAMAAYAVRQQRAQRPASTMAVCVFLRARLA